MSKDHSITATLVLAWNHVDDTIECLESIRRSNRKPDLLYVIDNASTDGTPEIVQERFPEVEVIQAERNLGIAGGYNLGMEHACNAGADFLLIANNDISIDPEMIGALERTLVNDPSVGMAVPKIYHYYGDRNRIWTVGGRWRKFPPSVKMIGVDAPDGPRFSEPFDLEFAVSCCLMLRRKAIEQVGMFDTGYFFYNDDWDYSLRYRKAGFRIQFVPDAKMYHKVSVSTQKSDKPAQWWRYFGRSTVKFYNDHARSWQLSTYIAWFTAREMVKGNWRRIRPFLEGVRAARHEEPE